MQGFVNLFPVYMLMFEWCFISQSYRYEASPICYFAWFETIIVPEALAGQAYFVTKMPDFLDSLLYNFIHLFIVI